MKVVATAPAKLILLGEYAVVEGAPAVVAAVDRRVRVEIEERAEGPWMLASDAPGARPTAIERTPDGRFVLEDGRSAREAEATRLLACLLEVLGPARTADLPPLAVQIESAPLHAGPGGAKLGLGSSAAVAVALGGALRHLFPGAAAAGDRHARATAFAQDLEAHRRAQGGRGSAVDVAASSFGGLFGYVRANEREATAARIEPLDWPAGLSFGVLWTGQPTRTADFLERWEAARHRRPRALEAIPDRLAALAEEGREAYEKADVDRILEVTEAYAEGLGALGGAIEAPILSPLHARLARLAKRNGVVYKPSGAGGGDVGVALGTSHEAMARTLEDAERAGCRALSLEVDRQGVTVLAR
ncbi:MAG: mevalonate kinase [Planctomycetota bacterium]